MNERTTGERVAVIEEVVLRMETKLDKHIDKTDRRVSRLERLAGWMVGALTVGAFWIRTHLRIE